MFNTLVYTKKLEEMGVSREDAEAYVTVFSEMIVEGVTSKSDMQNLKADLKGDIQILRNDMERGFVQVRSEIRGLSASTDKKLGLMMAQMSGLFIASVTLIIGAMAYFS